MNTEKSVGEMTPPYGTPCLRPALMGSNFSDSRNHFNRVLIILSSTLTMQLGRLIGL